ncbi:MAG: glycosyltransferase family 4 protein, partial [Candidatus Absconditabacteria bacterium]
ENIHASTYGSAIQASLLGIVSHKHVILTVHEVFGKLWFLYKGFWKGLPYLLFERLLFCFPYDAYHCVSRYTMNSIRLLYGVADSKIHLIYNGVDYNFWNSSLVSSSAISRWKSTYNPSKKYISLYYGHAGKSKGLDMLIESIPTVLDQEPDFLFVFNIIDSRRKSLLISRLQYLQKHGYKNNIQLFYGMDKSDLRIMIASADVVVAPSLSEGFGSVHTEVIAMHKPLITSFVASLPEVVSGKVIFVPPSSSDAITKALISIKKGQNIFADTPALHFNWDDTVTQIRRLYH